MIDLKGTCINAMKGGDFDSGFAKLYIDTAKSQGYRVSDSVIGYLGYEQIIGVTDWPRSGVCVGQTGIGSEYIEELEELTLEDLRAQLASAESIANSEEWKNGDTVLDDNYREVGVFVGMNKGGNAVIELNRECSHASRGETYRGMSIRCMRKPPTPAELAAKAREYELHEIADFMKNDKSPSDAEAIYNYITFKNYRVEE